MRFDAEQLRDRALTRLETLVMAESPSGEPELLRIVNADLEQAYRALGARVTRERGPDGDHLVCEWPGTAPDDAHILLIGHSDTVLPVGTTVERPFTLHEDGDTVTGPGVYDMKGSLVAIELAFVLLREQGLSPSRPVRLVVVNDEEIGSPDGRRIIAAHAEGAFAALGFEPPLPGGTLKTGRRGVARVRIDVQGVEAHAGLDASLGTSAIDELIDQIAVVRGAVPAPPAAEFNIGTISGGTRANVVAGTAWAEIGLRFATPAAEAAVLGALDSLTPVRPDAKLTVTRLSYRPAWERDPANPSPRDSPRSPPSGAPICSPAPRAAPVTPTSPARSAYPPPTASARTARAPIPCPNAPRSPHCWTVPLCSPPTSSHPRSPHDLRRKHRPAPPARSRSR